MARDLESSPEILVRRVRVPDVELQSAARQDQAQQAGRADIVMKSRAQEGLKNVAGPCTVEESSLLPSDGVARPRAVRGS